MASATDAEIALLREKIAHLEAALADKCRENEFLKSQLQLSGIARAPDAEKCARCGFAQGFSPKDAPDGPIFPNEIFPLIATYLEAGTRPLLNLARSCRSLYGLLLSHLYESFSTGKICGKVDMATRWRRGTSSLTHGLAFVKDLDAATWEVPDFVRDELVMACKNVVKLECDVEMFHTIYSKKAVFPLLERLDLWLPDDDDLGAGLARGNKRFQERIYHGMPNLRCLILKGMPCVELMELFPDSCPLLSFIWLSIDDEEFNPTEMPERFVAQIRRFGVLVPQTLATVIEHFPSFAPEFIEGFHYCQVDHDL